jgi:hypothetical protein
VTPRLAPEAPSACGPVGAGKSSVFEHPANAIAEITAIVLTAYATLFAPDITVSPTTHYDERLVAAQTLRTSAAADQPQRNVHVVDDNDG